MARSFYKAENLGSTPACALCLGKGEGARRKLHLAAGIHVWLCAEHRDPAFLRSRAGRDIVVSLMHLWRSAGCMTPARAQALDALHERILRPPRSLPGSYAWPELRAEAERRFAEGEDPLLVIAELRSRQASGPGPARSPSEATMRRWFRQGRWGAGDGPAG